MKCSLLLLSFLTTATTLLSTYSQVSAAEMKERPPPLKEKEGGDEPGKDKYEMCDKWAETGECNRNPPYMLKNCPESCATHAEHKYAMVQEVKDIKSIFELSAKDVDGVEVKFSDYEGSVIVFVNIAAHDPALSEQNFKELLELHEKVKKEDVVFLLFPSTQFGDTESGDPDEILEFVTNKGLLDDGMKFILMEHVKVNGPDAHIVFKYAQFDAVPAVHGITWNFDPYFLVHPSGELEAHHRKPPLKLFEPIMEHFGNTEL